MRTHRNRGRGTAGAAMTEQRVKVDVFDPAPPAGAVTYNCSQPGCTAVFPVDLSDPMDAHGNYLDHLDDHDLVDGGLYGDETPAEQADAQSRIDRFMSGGLGE